MTSCCAVYVYVTERECGVRRVMGKEQRRK